MSSKNPNTRTRILQATLVMLEETPDQPTRMSDIAKKAGISRQALYLHFPNRAELLIATTRYVDDVTDVEARFKCSREAEDGIERLEEFIAAWGGYVPVVHPVAQALLAMKDSDVAANTAWKNRMQAMREGCEAAVLALLRDGYLSKELSVKEATDILWTLLSVRNWELLTVDCGWTQEQYIEKTTLMARRLLL